jgi:hypothetical protein
MDVFLDALRIHGPWAAFVLAVMYIGKKHQDEDRVGRDEHDKRIKALEDKSVDKADFKRFEDRFEAHAKEMRAGQTEVLQLLAKR